MQFETTGVGAHPVGDCEGAAGDFARLPSGVPPVSRHGGHCGGISSITRCCNSSISRQSKNLTLWCKHLRRHMPHNHRASAAATLEQLAGLGQSAVGLSLPGLSFVSGAVSGYSQQCRLSSRSLWCDMFDYRQSLLCIDMVNVV